MSANLEPIEQLAIRIQANPGLYALLLGSGISKSAGIPTTWEVTSELEGKVRAIRGQDQSLHLDYSALLAELYPSQEERQGALQNYFEPTEEESEAHGLAFKRPTEAHKAIAWLIAKRFIKVVITTNFDSLLEQALQSMGVEPNVLLPEQVANAKPLHMMSHLIIKVHGDYRHTQLKNTVPELSEYLPEVCQLLEDIFRQHALVVAGWSAEYDNALVTCIESGKPSRHVAWLARHELEGRAKTLADQVTAEVLLVPEGSDSFFPRLKSAVEAAEDIRFKTPQSWELAVATLKRSLAGPEMNLIRAHDLFIRELVAVGDVSNEEEFPITTQGEFGLAINDRLEKYEALMIKLIGMSACAFRWNTTVGLEAVQEINQVLAVSEFSRGGSYNSVLLSMRLYPAMLLYYSSGVVCAARHDGVKLGKLLRLPVRVDREYLPAHTALHPVRVISPEAQRLITGMERRWTPLSERMAAILRPMLLTIIPSETAFLVAFDTFEAINSLAELELTSQVGGPYAPPGAFTWRKSTDSRGGVLSQLHEEVAKLRSDHWIFETGFFTNDTDYLLSLIQKLQGLRPPRVP